MVLAHPTQKKMHSSEYHNQMIRKGNKWTCIHNIPSAEIVNVKQIPSATAKHKIKSLKKIQHQ